MTQQLNVFQKQGTVWAGGNATLMSCFRKRPTAPGTPGTPYVASEVTSATITAYDTLGAAISGFPLTLTVSAVWFDSLQAWDVDALGHNFRYVIGPTAFPAANTFSKVKLALVFSDSTRGFAQWLCNIKNPSA